MSISISTSIFISRERYIKSEKHEATKDYPTVCSVFFQYTFKKFSQEWNCPGVGYILLYFAKNLKIFLH